jgi:serine/threonine-protein kinase
VMAAIVADPPVPLRALRPDAPVALERVILRCLEKDRTKRFANVAELARALEPFGPPSARESVERIARVLGAPATASAAGIATTAFAANPVPGAGSAVGWGRTETSSRRSRPVLTISVVALLLAAGAVAGVSLLKGGATADASASAGTSPAPPPATESATVAMGAASAAAAPSPPVPVAPSASLPVSPEPPARDQAARRSAPPRRTSATLRASAAPPATVAAPPATPEPKTPQPGPATTAPAPQSRPKAPASGVWDDMK